MRRAFSMSVLLVFSTLPAQAALSQVKTIEFPCYKNLADGRVLVDGTQWDEKMRQLGYVLDDGAYVPYEVLQFTQKAVHDAIWADGLCRMKLLPVAK